MASKKISELTAITSASPADELEINDAGASKKITFENITKRNIVVPITMEVPQGTVAFPDVHAMTTTISKKITGIVLPDGASIGIINWKCVIPEDLHTTSAQKVRIRFITQGTGTNHAVRLTLRSVGIAINEDMDIGMTSETEVTAECADANDTMNEALIEIDLTTDWASGDTVIGLLERDPVDGDDDYAGDILVVGMEMIMDQVGSA